MIKSCDYSLVIVISMELLCPSPEIAIAVSGVTSQRKKSRSEA